MTNEVKYLVEIRCPALSREQGPAIAAAVGRSFPAQDCRINPEGLTVALTAAHPLAYGALKDLADLLERELAQRGAPLQSGVIRQRAAVNPWRLAVNALAQILGRPLPYRAAPVMYFQRGLGLDLMLNARLNAPPRLELAADSR